MSANRNLRPTETAYIFLDDQGRAWVDDTAYRVSMVVRDYQGPDGYTPEQICEAHYHELTLAQVFAALSYYYDHKAAVDEEIAEEDRYIDTMQSEAEMNPWYQEMKERVRQKKRELGYDA